MIQPFIDLDHRLFVALNQSYAEGLNPLMKFLSAGTLVAIVCVVFLYFLIRKLKKASVWAILAVLGAWLVSENVTSKVIKPFFHRVRPAFVEVNGVKTHLPNGLPGGRYGFVSTHSSNAFALYPLMAGIIAVVYGFSLKQKRKILSAALTLAFLVAYSRIYLGVHYPADIFFGGIFGYLVGLGFLKLFLKKYNTLSI